ncbi:PQQ-dependent sugar dehydrogenase [Maribacter litoralis]|uniref:Glucose/arabinose dehydrogenase, beta-propeller fold n=1 Tax=Maribacter litoralis TaxID=2059726 RepID=A0A653MKL0_9FLAO|nr:PQQ-dependent sugar dehydrogenase [Maribacter litoralis]VXB04618.1 Glucose/arabinose dehydrogenase, beta-propeller fold [Maribacter litoralis]
MKRIAFLVLGIASLLYISCSDEDDLALTPNPNAPIDSVGVVTVTNAFPNLGFSNPLDLQSPSDTSNRLFVVEKDGVIKVFNNDADVEEVTIFLDISNKTATASELGLLGLAFHPDYNTNGFLYVTYTPSEQLAVVSRFKVSETDVNMVDTSSETVLLEIPQPATNHNGGQLAFGPDGYLYIASGDGGGSGDPDGNAQNLENLLGKILRIDVNTTDAGLNYAIPTDNPFVDVDNARGEIYAYGLRNPWRFSFDTSTNTIWAGDVGQGEKEEINLIEKGGNYGWNILEGTSCYLEEDCDITNTIAPLYEYGHEENDRSVTGGYVYRGNNLPSLQGLYVYGDFVSGRIWALDESGNNTLIIDTDLAISSFGIDADNELYICSFDGNIYQLTTEIEE